MCIYFICVAILDTWGWRSGRSSGAGMCVFFVHGVCACACMWCLASLCSLFLFCLSLFLSLSHSLFLFIIFISLSLFLSLFYLSRDISLSFSLYPRPISVNGSAETQKFGYMWRRGGKVRPYHATRRLRWHLITTFGTTLLSCR